MNIRSVISLFGFEVCNEFACRSFNLYWGYNFHEPYLGVNICGPQVTICVCVCVKESGHESTGFFIKLLFFYV